jgi:hypothetical protein
MASQVFCGPRTKDKAFDWLYLDKVKYFVTVQLGWGRHGGHVNGGLNV